MDAVLERTKTQTMSEPIAPPINGQPRTMRWTRKQYHQMAELGFFQGKRVELIKGEVVEMSPMKSTHATGDEISD